MKTGPILGTEVGGYRVEGVVGRGGMSIVFVAEHLRLGRKVALKILAPELTEDTGFRERFVRESRIAASLDHPNVIPIFDAGEDADFLYIAMRYVDGTDLRQLLEDEGPLQPRRAYGIVAQVAGALDAAHARGLIHRDVKPGNVLIDPQFDTNQINHVYLTDFGLVKETVSNPALTRPGQFVGTIPYVSPEQIQGKTVDHRADIYSLGCVLYECLTGQQPYPRDDDVAVMWAHVNDDPPSVSSFRPDLARGVDDVIAKALAKSPDARYQTCREFALAARRALRVSGDFDVLLEPDTPAAAAPVAARPPDGATTVSEDVPEQQVTAGTRSSDSQPGAGDTPTGSEADRIAAGTIAAATIAASTTTLGVDATTDVGSTVATSVADTADVADTVTVDVADTVTVPDAPTIGETVVDGDGMVETLVPAAGIALPEAPSTPSSRPPEERSRRVGLIAAAIVVVLLIGAAAILIPILSGDDGGGGGPPTGSPDGETGVVPGIATIGSFEPDSGPAGAAVVIAGTGLGDVTGIQFNGEPAAFEVVDDSEVTATVPEGATTGPISIVTAQGTAVSEADFVVIEPVGAPRALSAPFVGFEVVRLEWEAPRGGSPPIHYLVLRDGERIAKVTRELFRDTDVTPGQQYVYVVVAVGEDGSEARSKPLERTVPLPTTPESPPSSGPPSGGPPQDDGVCTFEEYLDGECQL